MTFFGAVSINFETYYPYSSEDYMDITVLTNWDENNGGSPDNIWADIIAAQPQIVDITLEAGYTLILTFQLIELDANGNYVDYGCYQAIFGGGSGGGYRGMAPVENGEFISIPTVDTTVKVLITHSELIYSPMP